MPLIVGIVLVLVLVLVSEAAVLETSLPPPLRTYPEKLGSGGLLPAELRGRVCRFFVCFFVCLFVRHATMLGTESLDGAYTH